MKSADLPIVEDFPVGLKPEHLSVKWVFDAWIRRCICRTFVRFTGCVSIGLIHVFTRGGIPVATLGVTSHQVKRRQTQCCEKNVRRDDMFNRKAAKRDMHTARMLLLLPSMFSPSIHITIVRDLKSSRWYRSVRHCTTKRTQGMRMGVIPVRDNMQPVDKSSRLAMYGKSGPVWKLSTSAVTDVGPPMCG